MPCFYTFECCSLTTGLLSSFATPDPCAWVIIIYRSRKRPQCSLCLAPCSPKAQVPSCQPQLHSLCAGASLVSCRHPRKFRDKGYYPILEIQGLKISEHYGATMEHHNSKTQIGLGLSTFGFQASSARRCSKLLQSIKLNLTMSPYGRSSGPKLARIAFMATLRQKLSTSSPVST